MNTELQHPAVSAVLSTAATLLGMEVVFIGGVDPDTFTFERVLGELPEVAEGVTIERCDSLCSRMLDGAPSATSDAGRDPWYRDARARARLDLQSYVGVPVRDAAGKVVATLCGVDRGRVRVDEAAIGVLHELAEIVAAHLTGAGVAEVLIRRTPRGWTVGGAGADDLTSAMVLADLLGDDLQPGARPPRPGVDLDEASGLRLTVAQLQHALAARVAVEQAIGVLAERQHSRPRQAFERLRGVARSRGRRVHELSRDVVASASLPGTPLPPELAGPR